MLRRLGAIAATLLLMAACGSTTSSDKIQDDATGSRTDATDVAPGTTDARSSTDGLEPDGSSPGSRTGARVTSPAGGPAGSSGAVAPPSTAKGKPLKIGLMYSTDANTVLAAIGADIQTGDARKIQDTVLAYINKTGGLAGHPLKAAYYDVKSTDSPSAISQGACTQWTQDDRVFVAFPAASVQDNNVMRNCLAKAGVPSMYPNFYNTTIESEYVKTPLWFEAQSLSLEAWARTYATGLQKQGFFTGAKIGLVYDEELAFTRTAERVLIPALKRAGANVVSTARSKIHGANDLSSGNTQMSNAVLKFRGAGVTKVMFFEVWQGWFLFAQNAQSQNWHPTYGLSGQNAVQIMIESGLVPLEQLPGAKLVGWNPGVDTGPPSSGEWPRLLLCKKIFREAGVSIAENGTQAYQGALASCGGLLALQDGARGARTPLTPSALVRGLESLGSELQAANLPSVRFGTNRHYAAATWRPGSYATSCECFRYNGPEVAIP